MNRNNYVKKLIIVGNGFDLAHGCPTTYKQFVDSVHNEDLEEFSSIVGFYCEKDIRAGRDWYEFEYLIGEVVINWFLFSEQTLRCRPIFSFVEEHPEMALSLKSKFDEDILHINTVFRKIEKLFLDYLNNVMKDRPIKILENIEREIDSQSHVLTFNYTSVIEEYTPNAFYVHGSLEESQIVFGHPQNPREPDVIEQEAILLVKPRLRDQLSFMRFINRSEEAIAYDQTKYLSMELEQQLNSYHSLDGEFGVAADTPELVKEWINFREQLGLECLGHVDLEAIEVLIIMGHSLQADYDILEYIIEATVNLKRVVLNIPHQVEPSFRIFRATCSEIWMPLLPFFGSHGFRA